MLTARRKHNDSDEDIEKVLAELALEYSGEKSNKDTVEEKTEPDEQKVDDDKKKGKKDKKKEKAEKDDAKDEMTEDTIAPEPNNVDADGEVSTVKTAAQKKKEKKEREKQKKLAQKKAVSNRNMLFIQRLVTQNK